MPLKAISWSRSLSAANSNNSDLVSVTSFSANKVASLISKFANDTIGIDVLRHDVVPVLRDVISQADDASKKVLAYVLWTKCLSICDYFDGEPMSHEASQALVNQLKGTITEALRLLASDGDNVKEAVRLAATIVLWKS